MFIYNKSWIVRLLVTHRVHDPHANQDECIIQESQCHSNRSSWVNWMQTVHECIMEEEKNGPNGGVSQKPSEELGHSL